MFGSIAGAIGGAATKGLGLAGKFFSSGLGSSLLASGLDAGVSSAFGLAGANRGYIKSKRLAKWQAALNYDYARQYARNSPSWTVSGYRRAGINPILAAMHGNLSVSDNPTSVNTIQSSAPDFSASASSRPFSQSFAITQRRRENEIANEAVKQSKIKTDSMLSDLERQRSSDFINTLLNSAKAAVLLKTPPGVVEVSKAGSSDDKSTPSVYGHFNKFGWVHNPSEFEEDFYPNLGKQAKAFQDALDLAAEKYLRDTLSLGFGAAKDLGSSALDFRKGFRGLLRKVLRRRKW